MADARTVFKRCVVQACSALHIQSGRFAAHVGLNDFLLDTFDMPRTPKATAVLALEQLCEGNNGPNDNAVCLAVMAFLDETLSPPSEDPDKFRRFKDLADLIAGSSNPAALEQWVETWYE